MTDSYSSDFYNLLSPQAIAFYKHYTGIEDDESLKQHIIQVQAKAYELYGYPCIRHFSFTRLKISALPGYNQALSLLLKELGRVILLDIGCCLGTDVRKAVFDGWPIQDVIASDIQQDFWEYGHRLFRSTPDTFPAAFIPGDVFDPTFISQRGPFLSLDEVEGTITPPLNTLSSLNSLQGKISAIHMSSFFHLFSEDRQLQLARIVSSLLSPNKGSIIFGRHIAMPVKGLRVRMFDGSSVFCHSPESWTQMWEVDIFGGKDKDGNNRIKVDTELVSIERKGFPGYKNAETWLKWSVTRL